MQRQNLGRIAVKILPLATVTLAALAFGCSERIDNTQPASDPPATNSPTAEAPPAHGDMGMGAAPAATGMRGKVVETMDSGGYTYALVDVEGKEAWVAGPPAALAIGDAVVVQVEMEMVDFYASSLDRTFSSILFASDISLAGDDAPAAMPSGHGAAPPVEDVLPDVVGITRAEGGATVEEILLMKDELFDTEVTFRGKVVKYNSGILGKNWLHVQDGTGATGTSDITITTDATCAVGDIVLVRGMLVADRDFGAGYVYDVIVEDAQVTVE